MNRFAIVFAVMLLCAVSTADARNPYRRAFFNLYTSAENTILDDVPSNSGHCGVCHYDFSGSARRNLYGYAVEAAIKSGNFGSTEAAIQSVENLDSDNDGYTNLVEITTGYFGNAPTFPGLNEEVVGLTSAVTLTDIEGYLTPSAPVETTAPAVTVISPNGGENLQAGTTVPVTWNATDASGIMFVNIELSDDGGATFKRVALREPNDGSFDWFVPNLPGNQSIIRVVATDNAGNLGSDWGNGTFTIDAVPAGFVPTTLRDMEMAGTQPLTGVQLEDPDVTCIVCHGEFDPSVEPWYTWKGSMMAQAQRDPLFLACVAVAEQDAPSVGDVCLRCHTPGGWSEGRSVDTGGGLINAKDRQGVQCDFCHRTVNPVYQGGVSPPQDMSVLDSLTTAPYTTANGQFVMDPDPIRRGAYNDADWVHTAIASPFHAESDMCGTCHNVSNPVFLAGATPGDYVPNAFDAPHPDSDPSNMFPVERTYGEWSVSEYASGGVFAPQFAGNKPDGIVSSCQDCHMSDAVGSGCSENGAPTRNDLPVHDLTGGNTCVPDMVLAMFPGEVDAARLDAGKQRALAMLQKAATLALVPGGYWEQPGQPDHPVLTVTVTNETAHKLPSGYPEGRRIWLNVKARDASNNVVYESGAYDAVTGELTHDADLKVYETHPGLSPGLASALGLPAGQSFHFVLCDSVYEDNRIPPRGFTNASFEAIQSPPVGYTYEDGQYWDETTYDLPPEAVSAEVTLYYQTTTKEYVEFLRDENVTNSAGDDLYDAWVAQGKCPPVVMASDATSLVITTGAEDKPPLLRTALQQNWPNPFNGSTVIPYSLASRQHVSIAVYDVQGRLVRTVVDEVRPAGIQKTEWDGRNAYGEKVASGVYFYRMKTPGQQLIRKALLLR